MKTSIFTKTITAAAAGLCLCSCSTTLTPAERESIRSATAKVLPHGTQVDVATAARTIQISAHLLEGHSADEQNPYVRGDYGDHSSLTRLVRYRCALILQSVGRDASIPTTAASIVVNERHGVRQFVVGGGSLGDEAMTLYSVEIPVQVLRSNTKIEAITSSMKVLSNIIPEISFSSVTVSR
jgi:hypothetical protein